MKTCTKCGETKPLTEYHKDKSQSSGYHPSCKACKNKQRMNIYHNDRNKQRDYHYQHKYGINLEEYNEMLELQGGVCSICGELETRIDKKTGNSYPLAIDHDHSTGKVRGLLCFSCNSGLGNFKDNPDFLIRASNYIKGED